MFLMATERTPRFLPVLSPFILMIFVEAMCVALRASCARADVLTVNSDILACDDTSLPDHVAYSRVLEVHPVRSRVLCLESCFRHSLCSHAMYTEVSDVTLASCVLFGGQMMRTRRTTSTDQLQSLSCSFLIMKPCANDGSFERGFCSCPEGLMGQRCENENEVDCLSRWTETYSTDAAGTVVSGDKSVLKNISSTPVGSYAKVKLQQSSSSLIVHGKGIYTFGNPFFSLQTSSTMSKQAWNQFQEVPTRQFPYIKEDGRVQTLDESSENVTVHQAATTWYARVPHVPRFLYAFDSSGKPLGTKVDDAFKAIIAGKEILSYSALKFNKTSLQLTAVSLEKEIGTFPNQEIIQPPYWYNSRITTSGTLDVIRVYVSSENLYYRSTSLIGSTFLVDPCWAKATQDRLGKEMTVGYLIGAILHGHRTRIVVDDMALNVEQVLVIDSTVFFDAESFMQPADSITPLTTNPTSARLVVDSVGRVVACNRRLLPSWNMTKTLYNATFLRWFIDTRPWSRVFTITTEGELLYGSESALFKALDRGASLQIGITMENSASYKYFLLTIRSLQLTLSGHVVAEAEGLSRLHEAPEVNCVSLALLVTSLGEVRMYSYNPRQAGNHSDGQYMTVDWFVDSYLP